MCRWIWVAGAVTVIVGLVGLSALPSPGSPSKQPRPFRVMRLGDGPLKTPIEFPPNSKLVAVTIGRHDHFLTGVDQCTIFFDFITDAPLRAVEDFYRKFVEKHYRGYFVKWTSRLRPGTPAERRSVLVFRDRSVQDSLFYVRMEATAREMDIRFLGLSPPEARKTQFHVGLSADNLLTEEFRNKDFVIPIPR